MGPGQEPIRSRTLPLDTCDHASVGIERPEVRDKVARQDLDSSRDRIADATVAQEELPCDPFEDGRVGFAARQPQQAGNSLGRDEDQFRPAGHLTRDHRFHRGSNTSVAGPIVEPAQDDGKGLRLAVRTR
jgi:hypothetical protein